MKLFNPFPAPIAYDKDSKVSNHDYLIALVNDLYSQSPVKEEGNFYNNGFTTYFYEDFTSHLDVLPELNELKQLIINKSEEYLIELAKHMELHGGPNHQIIKLKLHNVGIKIQKMWFNVNPPGAYQGNHHHSKNLLGGTYYLSIPENSGKIVFGSPNQFAWYKNQDPYDSHLLFDKFDISTLDGDLLIWPGWMDHEISLNKNSKDNRITISWGIDWNA